MNEDYFKERSLQSIYWAGFIASKGNISIPYNSVEFTTPLGKEERLHKFIKDTGCQDKVKNIKKITKYKSISIDSSQWPSDLGYIYNIPCAHYTPNLEKEEDIKAFLLGYIDAGSFIGYRPAGNNKEIFSICISGYPIICNWFRTYIDSWYPASITSKPTIRSIKSCKYFINGNRALLLIDLLHTLPINKSAKWYKIINET